MRATTIFRLLVGVTSVFVSSVRLEEEGLVLSVRPSWRRPRCGACHQVRASYDRLPPRRWQHLGVGSTKFFLEYAPRRVDCPRCGVKSEDVPWAYPGSRFTKDFEEYVAYLAQRTNQTAVTQLAGIAWVTVGAIVERVVGRCLPADRLTGLKRIGIDEFSYRKRHRFLTVVVDHDTRLLVWAGAGKTGETLKAFFNELGNDKCAEIKQVTMDMAGGYIKAVRETLPQAEIIFDRFHVQKLASHALDQVRREQLRVLRGTKEGTHLFRTRFVLLKSTWNLTRDEKRSLAAIQDNNKPLYRAYLLKESLIHALDYKQPSRAARTLDDWLAWASRSKLLAFVKLARTIRRHRPGILAYVTGRLTNGLAEGINNKLRSVTRRAFGFHSSDALIAMAFLCCAGIELNPPLPT